MNRKENLIKRIQKVDENITSSQLLDDARVNNKLNKIELSQIPKLSKNEFDKLSEEERESYISIIERIAAKATFAIKKEGNENVLEETGHLIVEALEEVKKIEELKQKEILEEVREKLIEEQSEEININRIIFNIKKSKVKTQNVLEFIKESYVFNNISNMEILSNENIKILEVVYLDLVSWNFPPYSIEECLLYSITNEIEFSNYKKILLSENESLRMKRNEIKEIINNNQIYNNDLKKKWVDFNKIEKLNYFIKEEFKLKFNEILEKGIDLF
jgi:hypothetical protein